MVSVGPTKSEELASYGLDVEFMAQLCSTETLNAAPDY